MRQLPSHTRHSSCFRCWPRPYTPCRQAGNFNGKLKSLKIWLMITILFGTIFLYGQGKEYWRLINEHITLSGSVFGTSFYALTGFHGFHVFVGLIILSIILAMAFLGDFKKPSSNVISTVGIYWHFVDIVWIVVFTVVYVLPKFTKI